MTPWSRAWLWHGQGLTARWWCGTNLWSELFGFRNPTACEQLRISPVISPVSRLKSLRRSCVTKVNVLQLAGSNTPFIGGGQGRPIIRKNFKSASRPFWVCSVIYPLCMEAKCICVPDSLDRCAGDISGCCCAVQSPNGAVKGIFCKTTRSTF